MSGEWSKITHILYIKEDESESQSIKSDPLDFALNDLEKAKRKLQILKEQARLYVIDAEETVIEKINSSIKKAKLEYENAKSKINELKTKISSSKKKQNQSWGNTMKPLFDAINFIGKYKLYRQSRYLSRRIGNGIGHFFGKVILGSSKTTRNKIKLSFKALYPKMKNNPKILKKYVDASLKYYGALLLDFMWNLPATTERPLHNFFSYKNLEVLDRALDKGNGVIIITTHMGEFLHIIPALAQFNTIVDKKKALQGYEPNNYIISAIAQLNNLPMYINNNRKHLNRLYLYPSVKFSKISHYLENHLKNNHILVIFHDYSNPKQLRVPFIYKKMNYLINTPQSYISLHKKTNAVILPVISHPNGFIGRTKFEFLEEASRNIMQTSHKYWNVSKKKFHGMLSTEINKEVYPYIRQYAHVWEEIMNFAVMRTTIKLKFPSKITISDFLQRINKNITGKMGIIDNSFEPERDDEYLLRIINSKFKKIIESLKYPKKIFRNHKTKITLSQLDSIHEIKTILSIIKRELKENKEIPAIKHINELIHEV